MPGKMPGTLFTITYTNIPSNPRVPPRVCQLNAAILSQFGQISWDQLYNKKYFTLSGSFSHLACI